MTAVVAWLALALSCSSLSWQVLSWIMSGPRVVVRSAEEIVFSDGRKRMLVIATSVGRQATTLHEIGFRVPRREVRGRELGPASILQGPQGGELPIRLDPGDEFTARFEGLPIEDFFRAGWQPGDLVPMARAGRKWVYGRFSADEHRVSWPT